MRPGYYSSHGCQGAYPTKTVLSTFYVSNNKLSVVQKLPALGAVLYGSGLVAQHAGEVLDNPDDAAAVGGVPVRQKFIDTNSWGC